MHLHSIDLADPTLINVCVVPIKTARRQLCEGVTCNMDDCLHKAFFSFLFPRLVAARLLTHASHVRCAVLDQYHYAC